MARFASYHRGSRAAFAALALVTAVACSDDDPTEVEEEPQVANIVVTVGASSATVPNQSGGAQAGALTLRLQQPNTVTFRFVGANGQDDAVVAGNRDEFELRAGTPLPTSLIFVPGTGGSGASFTATITPSVAGQVTIPFQLYNTHHGHAELARAVVVTVAP
jgi:hypothetical protein